MATNSKLRLNHCNPLQQMLGLVKQVRLIFMKRRPEFYEPPSLSYQKELMAFYSEAEQTTQPGKGKITRRVRNHKKLSAFRD